MKANKLFTSLLIIGVITIEGIAAEGDDPKEVKETTTLEPKTVETTTLEPKTLLSTVTETSTKAEKSDETTVKSVPDTQNVPEVTVKNSMPTNEATNSGGFGFGFSNGFAGPVGGPYPQQGVGGFYGYGPQAGVGSFAGGSSFAGVGFGRPGNFGGARGFGGSVGPQGVNSRSDFGGPTNFNGPPRFGGSGGPGDQRDFSGLPRFGFPQNVRNRWSPPNGVTGPASPNNPNSVTTVGNPSNNGNTVDAKETSNVDGTEPMNTNNPRVSSGSNTPNSGPDVYNGFSGPLPYGFPYGFRGSWGQNTLPPRQDGVNTNLNDPLNAGNNGQPVKTNGSPPNKELPNGSNNPGPPNQPYPPGFRPYWINRVGPKGSDGDNVAGSAVAVGGSLPYGPFGYPGVYNTVGFSGPRFGPNVGGGFGFASTNVDNDYPDSDMPLPENSGNTTRVAGSTVSSTVSGPGGYTTYRFYGGSGGSDGSDKGFAFFSTDGQPASFGFSGPTGFRQYNY